MLNNFFNRFLSKRQDPAKTEQAIDPINTELQKIIHTNQEKSENALNLARPKMMEYMNAKILEFPGLRSVGTHFKLNSDFGYDKNSIETTMFYNGNCLRASSPILFDSPEQTIAKHQQVIDTMLYLKIHER
jgi:hypothetical protein